MRHRERRGYELRVVEMCRISPWGSADCPTLLWRNLWPGWEVGPNQPSFQPIALGGPNPVSLRLCGSIKVIITGWKHSSRLFSW